MFQVECFNVQLACRFVPYTPNHQFPIYPHFSRCLGISIFSNLQITVYLNYVFQTAAILSQPAYLVPKTGAESRHQCKAHAWDQPDIYPYVPGGPDRGADQDFQALVAGIFR